jgi:DNA-binding LacI/PurR family transcriptional regulator
VLLMATDASSHRRIERYGRAGHVDGLIIASGHVPDPLPAVMLRTGLPVISNERSFMGGEVPWVGVDQAGGVRQAVSYLVGQGRRRIATIAGPQDMVAGIDRLTGYRTAVTDLGVRSIVAVGDFTRASGENAMHLLLDDDPDLDAVFVASDLMALGALHALHRRGRRVPVDVAVIGFDDVDLSRSTEPPLTTVRQPIVELGRSLAGQVRSLARGVQIEPSVVLPTTLVIRESA